MRKMKRQRWKSKIEECGFGVGLKQALGNQELLPDDWTATVKLISETKRKVQNVSSGIRKGDLVRERK